MWLPTFCLRVRQLPLLVSVDSGQAAVHQAMGLSSGIPSPRGLPQVLVMRHLLEVCPLSREMMLLSLNLYPPHYKTAFAFSSILYPPSCRLALRLTFPEGGRRAYHVPPERPWMG